MGFRHGYGLVPRLLGNCRLDNLAEQLALLSSFLLLSFTVEFIEEAVLPHVPDEDGPLDLDAGSLQAGYCFLTFMASCSSGLSF